MSTAFTHVLDVAKTAEPPEDGILTRTIFDDEKIKAVMFGFGQGEELSEHTAAVPAILHFLRGEATLTLGDEVIEAQNGTWVHMAASLPHSVRANTPVVMLLLMLKRAARR
jgi:quercetin dioxygenase-like cupin family protein